MTRTLINELNNHIGEKALIKGFVEALRNHGKIAFLELRDLTGLIQVILSSEEAKDLTKESVVAIEGLVKKRPENLINQKLETGTIEVESKKIETYTKSLPEFPISMGKTNESDQQIRLDWRFLDLRKPEKLLIFKVWTAMEEGFRNYWINNNYTQITSPKFIGAASESGAELFEVKYFDKIAYLAQSPQFYKQMAMAAGFEKVFEIGPVFRANPSFTSRHDTEFTMYDIEISFIESFKDVISEEEKAIVSALTNVKEKYGEEILKFYGRDLVVPTVPFPQVTMSEAKEILAKLNIPRESEDDLNPEEERQLCDYIKKTTGHEFVYVTEYPISGRPFYHMRKPEDNKLTLSFDLLWNGLEITTGAQREHRLEILEKQALEKGLKLESIKFYLDFFKYGMPPHGGCAIGPTRMLMKIFNLANVREVTYLYRGVNRLFP